MAPRLGMVQSLPGSGAATVRVLALFLNSMPRWLLNVVWPPRFFAVHRYDAPLQFMHHVTT